VSLAVGAILAVVFGGSNKLTFVLCPFLLVSSIFSVLRTGWAVESQSGGTVSGDINRRSVAGRGDPETADTRMVEEGGRTAPGQVKGFFARTVTGISR